MPNTAFVSCISFSLTILLSYGFAPLYEILHVLSLQSLQIIMHVGFNVLNFLDYKHSFQYLSRMFPIVQVVEGLDCSEGSWLYREWVLLWPIFRPGET
jgi:hypothetical protein